MKLFDKLRKKKSKLPALYSAEEIDRIENFITKRFGPFQSVFHEIVSPDIHVDIAVIPPNEEKPFYTLVTMGAGAWRMHIPDELHGQGLDRIEIVTYLPADWEVGNNEEKWYWPLRWLKILARLPIEQDTWLGWGHTVPNGGPFAENTQLCCALLLDPEGRETVLPFGQGEQVRFYQFFPLYEEEMNFKIQHDTEALMARFTAEEGTPIIRIDRRNVCGGKES